MAAADSGATSMPQLRPAKFIRYSANDEQAGKVASKVLAYIPAPAYDERGVLQLLHLCAEDREQDELRRCRKPVYHCCKSPKTCKRTGASGPSVHICDPEELTTSQAKAIARAMSTTAPADIVEMIEHLAAQSSREGEREKSNCTVPEAPRRTSRRSTLAASSGQPASSRRASERVRTRSRSRSRRPRPTVAASRSGGSRGAAVRKPEVTVPSVPSTRDRHRARATPAAPSTRIVTLKRLRKPVCLRKRKDTPGHGTKSSGAAAVPEDSRSAAVPRRSAPAHSRLVEGPLSTQTGPSAVPQKPVSASAVEAAGSGSSPKIGPAEVAKVELGSKSSDLKAAVAALPPPTPEHRKPSSNQQPTIPGELEKCFGTGSLTEMDLHHKDVALEDLFYSRDCIPLCFGGGAIHPLLVEHCSENCDLLDHVIKNEPLVALRSSERYYCLQNRRLFVLKTAFSDCPRQQLPVVYVDLAVVEPKAVDPQKLAQRITTINLGVDIAVLPPDLFPFEATESTKTLCIRLGHTQTRDHVKQWFRQRQSAFPCVQYHFFFDTVVLTSRLPSMLNRAAGAMQIEFTLPPRSLTVRLDLLRAHVAMHVFALTDVVSEWHLEQKHEDALVCRGRELHSIVKQIPQVDEKGVMEMYAQVLAECPEPAVKFIFYGADREEQGQLIDNMEVEKLLTTLWGPTRLSGITLASILLHRSQMFFEHQTCIEFLMRQMRQTMHQKGALLHNFLHFLGQLAAPPQEVGPDLLHALLRLLAAVDDAVSLDEELAKRTVEKYLHQARPMDIKFVHHETVVSPRRTPIQVADPRVCRVLSEVLPVVD